MVGALVLLCVGRGLGFDMHTPLANDRSAYSFYTTHVVWVYGFRAEAVSSKPPKPPNRAVLILPDPQRVHIFGVQGLGSLRMKVRAWIDRVPDEARKLFSLKGL